MNIIPEPFTMTLAYFSCAWFFLLIFAYFCGSIPSGPILAKIFKLGDMREKGSGNIGATNMARIGGKKLGILVALCDTLKGVVPVMVGRIFSVSELTLALLGLMAVLGHIFPLWLRFKGGKGIATSLGAITALSWELGVIYGSIWLLVFITVRMASLASIIGIVGAWIASWGFLSDPAIVVISLMGVTVLYKHSSNIKRLLQGTEQKFK